MPNQIHNTAQIYRDVEVLNSTIGRYSIIGDFSRVRDSYIGDYASIDRQNFLLGVNLGSFSYTGPWNMIFQCVIGKFCSISYGVTLGPPEHDYHLLSTHPFIYNSKYEIFPDQIEIKEARFKRNLQIGNDVWIGCNSVILRGINIGDGAVVGANSLVNKDVPPYAIVAGTPAKIVKYRFPHEVIERLLELKWWNWSIGKIKNNRDLFTETLNFDKLNGIK